MSNGIVQVNEETLDTFINQRNLPCGESVRSGHLSKAGCSEKDALLFLAVNRGDLSNHNQIGSGQVSSVRTILTSLS